MMRKLISKDYKTVKEFTDSINLFEAQSNLAAAWEMVTESTVKNCWKNLTKDIGALHDVATQNEETDFEFLRQSNLFGNLTQKDFDDWMSSDNHEKGYKIFSDEEIAELVQNGLDPLNLPMDEVEEANEEIGENRYVSKEEFDDAVETVSSFLSQEFPGRYNDIVSTLGSLQIKETGKIA